MLLIPLRTAPPRRNGGVILLSIFLRFRLDNNDLQRFINQQSKEAYSNPNNHKEMGKMTKEQMRKEIERMNAKVALEMEELANLANWMLSKRGEPETITFHSPSRLIGEHEAQLKEYIARRDTLREILGEE